MAGQPADAARVLWVVGQDLLNDAVRAPLFSAADGAGSPGAAQALLLVVIVALSAVIISAAYLGSIIWAGADAANRGKPWFLVMLFVALAVGPSD